MCRDLSDCGIRNIRKGALRTRITNRLYVSLSVVNYSHAITHMSSTCPFFKCICSSEPQVLLKTYNVHVHMIMQTVYVHVSVEPVGLRNIAIRVGGFRNTYLLPALSRLHFTYMYPCTYSSSIYVYKLFATALITES